MNKFDIKFFENYKNSEKLFEFKLPIMRFDEILSDVALSNDKIHRSILVTYYKTYNDYIDLIDKKTHHFKVNDLAGNIINNNRVIIDVIIFNKEEMEKIKENIVEFSIGEFYSLMPTKIDVFGINMKPTSFLKRDEIAVVFNQNITDEMAKDVVSNVTGFQFEKIFNDFYIWSKR